MSSVDTDAVATENPKMFVVDQVADLLRESVVSYSYSVAEKSVPTAFWLFSPVDHPSSSSDCPSSSVDHSDVSGHFVVGLG